MVADDSRGRTADATTLLFVPGNRPERFAKADNSGADIVIVDWEDAVPLGDKALARASTVGTLASSKLRPVLIRVHGEGEELTHDLAALKELAGGSGAVAGVMIAKAEQPEQIRRILEVVPGCDIVPLVETATGLLNAAGLAATEGATRLAFGALDFALDTGIEGTTENLLPIHIALTLASRGAGIAAPIDSPSVELQDPDLVRADSALARSRGFGGKLCIHPSQVQAVKEGFAPTDDEVAWARSVVDAAEGAVRLDGHMVDLPVTQRARRILVMAAMRP